MASFNTNLLYVQFVIMLITMLMLSLFPASLSSPSYTTRNIATIDLKVGTISKNLGFTAPLIHRIYSPKSPYYNPNLTLSNRIQLSIRQSILRYQRYVIESESKSSLSSMNDDNDDIKVPEQPDWIEAPVSPVDWFPEYMLSYKIGTPATETIAIIDTGSSLSWLQCEPCEACYKQKTPIFDPRKSSTYSRLKCNDTRLESCYSTLFPMVGKCNTTTNLCEYDSKYLGNSYSKGDLSTETLTFGYDQPPGSTIRLLEMAFGCGHNNTNNGMQPGIIALDRTPSSFPSQLGNFSFSYCFIPVISTSSPESQSSKIHFGLAAKIVGGKTPVVTKPKNPGGYYVNLEGISVNNKRLPIPPRSFNITPDGLGGFIVDSGTSYTFLNPKALDILVKAVANKIRVRDRDDEPGFPLCYWVYQFDHLKIQTPKVTFHFSGVDLEVSTGNIWVEILRSWWRSKWCLAMRSGDKVSILGNYQQRNVNVGYDLDNNVISFQPMDCTKA